MVRSSARILTGGARDSSPLPSARKCGQGKPFPSQMCAGQSSVRGNPMCGQDVRGSSYRARRSAKHSSPQQQQQLVASAARLRDPIICAGPDMSDTESRKSTEPFEHRARVQRHDRRKLQRSGNDATRPRGQPCELLPSGRRGPDLAALHVRARMGTAEAGHGLCQREQVPRGARLACRVLGPPEPVCVVVLNFLY